MHRIINLYGAALILCPYSLFHYMNIFVMFNNFGHFIKYSDYTKLVCILNSVLANNFDQDCIYNKARDESEIAFSITGLNHYPVVFEDSTLS